MNGAVIRNRYVSLTVDAKGCVTGLKNKATSTELIAFPEACESWRIVMPTGKHTRDFVLGSMQRNANVRVVEDGGERSIEITHRGIHGDRSWDVNVTCRFRLSKTSSEIIAGIEIENRSDAIVEEVEFPAIGGIGGFRTKGRKEELDLVAAGDRGKFFPDVLHKGLPDTGRESNHFVRALDTSMFAPDWGGVWVDLYCDNQGLFLGHLKSCADFAFKIEKYPKESTSPGMHCYPKGTPRWVRVWAVHAPRIAPGDTWTSEPIHIMPHEGDWHSGADRYSRYRHTTIQPATQPEWMNDFVGWTEILGKTYLGEVFHDYAACAREVIKDKNVTGIDLVFYYGHTKLGSEGADFDHSPDPALGGERGFRKMVDDLHANGIRIILLDHFHRWINRDIPEYGELGLEKIAVLDESGRPRTARWWKETFLSCRKLEGPTPEWVEMCPSSDRWLSYYLDHVTRMIDLGVDGLELDTFECPMCFSDNHGHEKGEDLFPVKMQFMRKVRAHAKKLNPDFVLIGENMIPETREVFDGFYSSRYLTEVERIYQYLFPEMNHQSVLVGNYTYDQVNKALCMTAGIDTEIDGLRRTAYAACPELAEYIGEVNRFKRKHRSLMMHGRFRDTLGATVKGDCLYSVIEGSNGGRALVLRNHHDVAVKVRARLDETKGLSMKMWRPFGREKSISTGVVEVSMKPFEAVVVFGLKE